MIDSNSYHDRLWTQIEQWHTVIFIKKYSFTADLLKFLRMLMRISHAAVTHRHLIPWTSRGSTWEHNGMGLVSLTLAVAFTRGKIWSFPSPALPLILQRKKIGLILGRLRLKRSSGHLPQEPGENWFQEALWMDAPVHPMRWLIFASDSHRRTPSWVN